MSKVEVLVACMQQGDDSLYEKMNLQTDAVLANQCGFYGYSEYIRDNGHKVKLVSTADRGVGKNRNIALLNSTGDYLLCSDEDMIYVDGYEKMIKDAFDQLPKADIIVFDLEYLNKFTKARKPTSKCKRVHIWNCMRYGTARVAMRKSSIDKANIWFSTLYGGGAKYSSGEDSLFIREAMRKGLKIYTVPITIAKVKQETSSWFKGYTDKFFIDKGILLANAFPKMCKVLIYYFAFNLRHVSKQHSFAKIVSLMKTGVKNFKKMD